MEPGTVHRQKELWVLAASPFVLAAILISNLMPAANYFWISSRAKTQNALLTSIVEYRSLLSALDESTRAVILAPDRSDLRDRRKESIQALKDHLEKMVEFSPGEGPISQDLLLLASHLRKSVEARSAEVERYARAPGEWAMQRFHGEYAVARAQHAAIVQHLSEEARDMLQSALRNAYYRICVSTGILLLIWSASAAFAAGKVRLGRVSTASHPPARSGGHAAAEPSISAASAVVSEAHEATTVSSEVASTTAAATSAAASDQTEKPSAAAAAHAQAATPSLDPTPAHAPAPVSAPAAPGPAIPEPPLQASIAEEGRTPVKAASGSASTASTESPIAASAEPEKPEDFMPPGVVDLNAILAGGNSEAAGSATSAEATPAESSSAPTSTAETQAPGPLSAEALAASFGTPAAEPTPAIESASAEPAEGPSSAALEASSQPPSADTGKFAQVVLPKDSTTEIDLSAPIAVPTSEPPSASEAVEASSTPAEPAPDPINLETVDPSTMTAEQLTAHLLGGSAGASSGARAKSPAPAPEKEKPAAPAGPPKTIRGSDIVAQKSAQSDDGAVDLSF